MQLAILSVCQDPAVDVDDVVRIYVFENIPDDLQHECSQLQHAMETGNNSLPISEKSIVCQINSTFRSQFPRITQIKETLHGNFHEHERDIHSLLVHGGIDYCFQFMV